MEKVDLVEEEEIQQNKEKKITIRKAYRYC